MKVMMINKRAIQQSSGIVVYSSTSSSSSVALVIIKHTMTVVPLGYLFRTRFSFTSNAIPNLHSVIGTTKANLNATAH